MQRFSEPIFLALLLSYEELPHATLNVTVTPELHGGVSVSHAKQGLVSVGREEVTNVGMVLLLVELKRLVGGDVSKKQTGFAAARIRT